MEGIGKTVVEPEYDKAGAEDAIEITGGVTGNQNQEEDEKQRHVYSSFFKEKAIEAGTGYGSAHAQNGNEQTV